MAYEMDATSPVGVQRTATLVFALATVASDQVATFASDQSATGASDQVATVVSDQAPLPGRIDLFLVSPPEIDSSPGLTWR